MEFLVRCRITLNNGMVIRDETYPAEGVIGSIEKEIGLGEPGTSKLTSATMRIDFDPPLGPYRLKEAPTLTIPAYDPADNA